MSETIKKTSLYENHKKLNANIVNFNQFYLPVSYTSIIQEHNAVRNSAGLFDVSHMGNLILNFKDKTNALAFLNYLFPNDFSDAYPGKCIYSTMLYENSTVIDDLIVMSLSETEYHIIVNSVNIIKDYNWIKSKITDSSIEFENKSGFYSILALQGPNAFKILKNELEIDADRLNPFEAGIFKYKKTDIIISRTGYTGEDGFELVIKNELASELFEEILSKGRKYDILPCGLGCRDTLRIEASYPLYGHELDENHSPLQANISWSIKLNKAMDFIGKKALLSGSRTNFTEKLKGFEIIGKAISRQNMKIIDTEKNAAGYVTSGTYSPTLQKNIGLSYLKPDFLDKELFIEIRNRIEPIKIVKLPFYKKK